MPSSKPISIDKPFTGVIFAISAFALLAFMNAAAKWVTDVHSVFEVAFYRSFFSFIPMVIWIVWTRQGIDFFKTNKPITLFFRVVVGIFGLALTFLAISKLPMANATLVFMCSVLILPVFAHIFLGEKSGIHHWGAIIIGLGGVALILEPSGQGEMLGYIIAFGAAITHASAQTILRALKSENPMMVIFYFFGGGTLIMLPFIWNDFQIPTSETLPFLLMAGFTGGFAQLCLTKAMKYAPAPLIAPFNYTGLLFASGLDIVIWGYVPGFNIWIGGMIIIAMQLYIIHREKQNKAKVLNA